MNVLDIVRAHLAACGYDGLFSVDGDCACRVGDLAPCGDVCGTCEPGYVVHGGEGGACESGCVVSGGEGGVWRIARERPTPPEADTTVTCEGFAYRGACLPGCRRLTRYVNAAFCVECRRPLPAQVEHVPGRGHLAIVLRAVVPWLTPETPIEDAASGTRYRINSVEMATVGDKAVLVLSPE